MMETVRRLWGGAKKFAPHEFASRVELAGGLPRVLVSREAYEDMYCLVDFVDKEVGWLGSVERLGNDFLVKEVFLFDQETHATTCEITPDGMAEFAMALMSSRPDGMEVANSIRFWGHSHVNMGTSPSGQDESQLRELAASCGDFFVRGIMNKNGRMEWTIVLASIGVVIHDAVWELYEPAADEARRQRWQAEIAAKVREKVIPQVVFSGQPGYTGAGFGAPDRFARYTRDAEAVVENFRPGKSTKGKGGHNGR
jgi:hypothetical protein